MPNVNDGGLDVTEHATAAEEVEAEAIEPEFLATRDGVGMEDEGLGQATRLQGDLGGLCLAGSRGDHLRSAGSPTSHPSVSRRTSAGPTGVTPRHARHRAQVSEVVIDESRRRGHHTAVGEHLRAGDET